MLKFSYYLLINKLNKVVISFFELILQVITASAGLKSSDLRYYIWIYPSNVAINILDRTRGNLKEIIFFLAIHHIVC